MFITRHHLTLLGLGGLTILGATACNLSVDLASDVDGSGTAQTSTYDFDDFTEVDISSAFEATITVVDGPPTIEVTLDDNLFEYLEVGIDDGELEIKMSRGNIDYDVVPTAIITLPALTEVDVSGASQVTIEGAEGDELTLDVSGASEVTVEAEVASLDLDSSGASSIAYEGTADAVEADISGASSVSFADASVRAADVDLNGASHTVFGSVDRVTGEANGASSVEVPESANVSVETSGASSVSRN